ncbi:MAG: carbohydrate ABC transporter substrate-binding protein, partial [Candidatus Humimicrobiaceae bacterium]
GTEGSFMMLSDSFSLPTNIKNRDAAIGWLEVVGSKEGQDAFNPIKGSIPPRTDCDVSLYDPYLQSSIKDYATNKLTPSIKHGAAVSEPWAVEIDNVMTMLVSDKNVEAAAAKFQSAADEFIK